MIDIAEAQDKLVAVQGNRYEGYMVWINALIASAGGQILEDPAAGSKAAPTVASPGRRRAPPTSSGVWPAPRRPRPTCSTATEEEVRSTFQSDRGAFMVNWPYVYQAATHRGDVGRPRASPSFDDIGWARYPEIDAGSRAPRRSAASTSASATSPSTRTRRSTR